MTWSWYAPTRLGRDKQKTSENSKVRYNVADLDADRRMILK